MELLTILARESHLKICYCIVLDAIAHYSTRLTPLTLPYFLLPYTLPKYTISIQNK